MKFVIRIIRQLFGIIDSLIYETVCQVFQLIFDLANVEIFTGTTINKFANRLYVILGLIMIFKLIISFIQIIVNPDKMDDKEKGIGNVLGRVVISLVLIVMVPSIFSLARQIQNYVIPVIPRVFLGRSLTTTNTTTSGTTTSGTTNNQNTLNSGSIEEISRDMAFYSFLPFFNYDNPSCNDGSIKGTGGTTSNVTIYSVTTAVANANKEDTCSTNTYGFKYEYRYILSTIVGGYLLFVLIQIAVAVAVRAIKFAICEFVAPIPIASYIDPKTSKQTFEKWVSVSVKTYTDLFIRLILIYFMIFVFNIIANNDTMSMITSKLGGDLKRTVFVVLFLIVGLLQFVRTAPKFISDLLGLQGDSDIMGMFRGEGYRAFREAAGIPGTALAAAGAGIGNARYAWKNGDKFRALFRGVGGAVGATRRGVAATLKGDGWHGAYTDNIRTTTGISQRKVNAHFMARQSRKEYDDLVDKYNKELTDKINNINRDPTLSAAAKARARAAAQDERDKKVARIPRPIQPIRDRVRNAADRWMGMESPTGGSYSSAASTLSSWREKFFTGEAMKKLDEEGSKLDGLSHSYTIGKDATGKDIKASFNYSQVRKAYDQLMNGTYSGTIIDSSGHAQRVDQSRIRELFSAAQKNGAIDYINAALDPTFKDIDNSTLTEMDKQVRGMIEGLGIENGLKRQLLNEYSDNPGEFFKNLSEITKQLETSGGRRSSYEQNQENNKK